MKQIKIVNLKVKYLELEDLNPVEEATKQYITINWSLHRTEAEEDKNSLIWFYTCYNNGVVFSFNKDLKDNKIIVIDYIKKIHLMFTAYVNISFNEEMNQIEIAPNSYCLEDPLVYKLSRMLDEINYLYNKINSIEIKEQIL